jgi:hypothetical protein
MAAQAERYPNELMHTAFIGLGSFGTTPDASSDIKGRVLRRVPAFVYESIKATGPKSSSWAQKVMIQRHRNR